MGKKNKAGGIPLLDFKLYYKAIVIKTVWYWHKNRYIHQRNRIKRPQIKGQLICDKRIKNTKWGKDSLFNKWYWGKQTATCNRRRLDHYFTHIQKLTQNGLKI